MALPKECSMIIDKKSLSYHLSKLRFLINRLESQWSTNQPNYNLYNLTQQSIDLLELIQGSIKPIDWYRKNAKYSQLTFTETPDDPNYNVRVSNSLYEASFEQAKSIRDNLIADGLIQFVVEYESNGELDWDVRFENIDYLRVLKEEHGNNWSIKRSETNPDNYFFTVKGETEITLENAVGMANSIKRRHVYINPIIYYGPGNTKKIIGTMYDNTPAQTEETIDRDPRDT